MEQIDGVNDQERTVTIQGLAYIHRGIITLMVGSAITLFLIILGNLLFSGWTRLIFIVVFGIIQVLVALVVLLLAMFFVLKGISKVRKGDLSKDIEYAQDMRTSKAASLIYLSLVTIVPFMAGLLFSRIAFLLADNIPLFLAVTNSALMVIGAFSLPAFIVMFTYPLGHWTSKRSFDLLITFAALLCFVWVGRILLSMSADLMFLVGQTGLSNTVSIFSYLLRLLEIIASIPLLIAYRRTLNSLKGKTRSDPREQMNFIPNFTRFMGPGKKPSPKPSHVILMVILLVMSLVIVSSVLDYVKMVRLFGHSVPNDNWNDNEVLIQTNSVEVVHDGELIQGESIDEAIDVGLPLLRVEVVLRWTDETSDPTYTNNPDSFSMRVGLMNGPDGETIDMEEKTGANNVNGPGEISISFSYRSDSPKIVGSIDILVTLVETGDQVGSYLGLRTRADDSNIFSLTISYEHLEE